MSFKEIKTTEIKNNTFELLGKDWTLITAGGKDAFNTMTASWGGLGVMWNKDVATIVVRPQRHTKQFIDSNDYFTLSFFGEEHRKDLVYCGRHSGKDVDKISNISLTPCFSDNTTYFEEAKLVLICKKLYASEMKPEGFIDKTLDEKNYPDKDYHTMYIGEVTKVLVRE